MGNIVFLNGLKIELRPLDKTDLTTEYIRWLNDPEVSQYLISGVFPSNMDQLENFYQRISLSNNDVMFAIIRKDTKKHIGNIKLGDINWVHRFANIGIMIGDKESWGQGCAQEACRLVIEYAFKRLNLNKVTLTVVACHTAAIRVYEKIGFKLEGRVKDIFFLSGRYEDQLIMGVLRDEYER